MFIVLLLASAYRWPTGDAHHDCLLKLALRACCSSFVDTILATQTNLEVFVNQSGYVYAGVKQCHMTVHAARREYHSRSGFSSLAVAISWMKLSSSLSRFELVME